MLRVDGTHGHDFLHFRDGRLCSHGHEGIEISSGQPVSKISQLIGLLRFDEGVVGLDRQFQNAALTLQETLFLSFGDFGADAHGGVETLQASAGGAHALAQNLSLIHI